MSSIVGRVAQQLPMMSSVYPELQEYSSIAGQTALRFMTYIPDRRKHITRHFVPYWRRVRQAWAAVLDGDESPNHEHRSPPRRETPALRSADVGVGAGVGGEV